MALHGEVKINGHTIVSWEAVRQQRQVLDDDQISTYRCTVSDANGEEHVVDRFLLPHRYGDGAAVLAYKVLRAYAIRRSQ